MRITNNELFGINQVTAAGDDETNLEDYNFFFNNGSGELNNIAAGAHSHCESGGDHAGFGNDDVTEPGYTAHRWDFTFDNGNGNCGNIQAGDHIELTGGAGWTATVRYSSATDPNGGLSVELDAPNWGWIDDNDAFTVATPGGGGAAATGNVFNDPSIDDGTSSSTPTDYRLTAAALMAGTNAPEIDIGALASMFPTAGFPKEYTAGGGRRAYMRVGGR